MREGPAQSCDKRKSGGCPHHSISAIYRDTHNWIYQSKSFNQPFNDLNLSSFKHVAFEGSSYHVIITIKPVFILADESTGYSYATC